MHHERCALALGQVVEAGQDGIEGLATFRGERRVRVVVAKQRSELVDVGVRAAAAQRVERAVADDRVQPRAQRDLALVAAQRAVGADECLLDDVLGVVMGAAEDPPRVGEQPRLVAGDELRVGVRIAAAHALDELLVGDREVEDLSHGRRFGPRGPRLPATLGVNLSHLVSRPARELTSAACGTLVAVPEDPLQAHRSTPAELQARIAAERGGRPFLVYRDSDGAQLITTLTGERASIGRAGGADVELRWDEEISRLHAELERIAGEWTVADDGLSRNGTWVNGERISGRHRLRDGDLVRVGRTVLAFRDPGPELSAAPTRAGGTSAAPPTLTSGQRAVLDRAGAALRARRAGDAGDQPGDRR